MAAIPVVSRRRLRRTVAGTPDQQAETGGGSAEDRDEQEASAQLLRESEDTAMDQTEAVESLSLDGEQSDLQQSANVKRTHRSAWR